MKTRNGIEWDLTQSDYIFKYNDIEFYFSSMFYLNKFKKELINYIDNETKKIYNKFKIEVDYSIMFAIALYKKIEKRGCRILYQGKEINFCKFVIY